MTPLVFELFLWTLPGIGVGIYLGSKIHRMIPTRVFHRLLYTLLVTHRCTLVAVKAEAVLDRRTRALVKKPHLSSI